MLCKFFSPLNGIGERGGPDYILDNPTARVVRGNVEITRAVIDSCPPNLSQRFSAGVVNDLSELSADAGELLLDELELQLLAGRPQQSMPWLVVEQTDKGKKENHFVIPIYDLVFETNLHPYVDRIDQHGFEAWVEHFNLRRGILPPGHRLRMTPDFEHLRIDVGDIEFLRLVWGSVQTWVTNKDVGNRRELEARLIQDGYRVRCNSHAGKPLEQPVILGPRGNQLRLKGSVYYRPDFGLAKVKPLDLSDEKAVRVRLAQLREIMSDRFDFRAHHLIGRIYGKKEQERVTLGRARQHFEELIRKKMMDARCDELSAQRVDYSHIVQVLSGLNSGLEPVILQRESEIAVDTLVPRPYEAPVVKTTVPEVEETAASVVLPVLESVEFSGSKANHSEDSPAPVVEHSQTGGEHVEKPSVTMKSEVNTTENVMKTSPSVAIPNVVSVESTGSKSDQTKPHRLPSDDQTQIARKAGKKRSKPKKSVRSGKTPISKELDCYPEI